MTKSNKVARESAREACHEIIRTLKTELAKADHMISSDAMVAAGAFLKHSGFLQQSISLENYLESALPRGGKLHNGDGKQTHSKGGRISGRHKTRK